MNGWDGVLVPYRSADSFRFFYGICSSDKETRAQALNSVSRILDCWLDGYGSPPGGSGADASCESGSVCSANPQSLVKEQLPDLLRLSTDCPFADVRERCCEILADLQNRAIEIPHKRYVGVSSFIPSSEAVTIDERYTRTYDLLVTAFLQNNRLENLFQVMAYHPQYLECFLRTQQYLMRGDGPLPFTYRHYIAIMLCSLLMAHPSKFYIKSFFFGRVWAGSTSAVTRMGLLATFDSPRALKVKMGPEQLTVVAMSWSRVFWKAEAVKLWLGAQASEQHQCSYLINIHTSEYLLQGGDERWLRGREHMPSKLSKLQAVNEVLCHQPWLISKDHIENLAKGADNWSMSELMQAVVLLIHFHSLSGFVYGCGVNPEADHPNGHVFGSIPAAAADAKLPNGKEVPKSNGHLITADKSPNAECDSGIEMLMERMMWLMCDETRKNVTADELLQSFEKFETENLELMAANSDSLKWSSSSSSGQSPGVIEDSDFCPLEQLSRREQTMRRSTFRVQDYSWEDHGYSLSNRLYTEIGTLFDEKLNVAQNLTYHSMGNNANVDTSSFRHAIWNYIQCLYGIRHDDYDYELVDQLLERNLKSYIRTVAFHPERVMQEDYSRFMADLKHSEKVHINLMLLEARLQAQLLYSLRAITRYMK